jgi:glucosamine-6-phosphate deaminase
MLKAIVNETERVLEKVDTHVYDTAGDASKAVAAEIAALIQSKAALGKDCVLGLATGSTPKEVYAELIRLHKEEGLSFKNVVTYNLDEYFPMLPNAEQSYVLFMQQQLFDHVDIPSENCNVPDGTLNKDEIVAYCDNYEKRIEKAGGLDLQILGIGGNGHIGFNESGSLISSKTRLIALDEITRINAQNDFYGLDKTPRRAITLGVQKIMEAKRVILMAWGEKKAGIIAKSVEGNMTAQIPASYLQTHANTSFVLDEPASEKLTRVAKPWLVGAISWNDELRRHAVTDLANSVNKPILKLTDKDYNEAGLNDLLLEAEDGTAHDVNIKIFSQLQHTITGWPGGKPSLDDTTRPERAQPEKKRVLIFSPHPDDDIISMGGTFQRLVDQGHEVHVAYQTSGNIAVSDDEAIRFADFVSDLNGALDLGKLNLLEKTTQDVAGKTGSTDSDSVRTIKGLIRRSEAKATGRFVGIPDSSIHFLDLPFYETGEVKKKTFR